jgi:hypothetical protein
MYEYIASETGQTASAFSEREREREKSRMTTDKSSHHFSITHIITTLTNINFVVNDETRTS